MSSYDWFITCVAIPGMIIGFIGVIGLWCYAIYDIFIDR